MPHFLQTSSPDRTAGLRPAGAERRSLCGRADIAVAWGLVGGAAIDRRQPPALAVTPRPEPVDPSGFSMSGFG